MLQNSLFMSFCLSETDETSLAPMGHLVKRPDQPSVSLLLSRLYNYNPHEWLIVVLDIACQRKIGKRLPPELVFKIIFEYKGFLHPLAQCLIMDFEFYYFVRGIKLRMLITKVAGSCTCGGGFGAPTWSYPVDMASKYITAQIHGQHFPLTKQIACHIGRVGVCRWTSRFDGDFPRRQIYDTDPYNRRSPLVATTSCSLRRLWALYARNYNNNEAGYYYNTLQNSELEFSELDYIRNASRGEIRYMIGRAHGVECPSVVEKDYISRAEWVRVYYNSLRAPAEQLKDWPRRNR